RQGLAATPAKRRGDRVDVLGDGQRVRPRETWTDGHHPGEAGEVGDAQAESDEVAADGAALATGERVTGGAGAGENLPAAVERPGPGRAPGPAAPRRADRQRADDSDDGA